MKKIILILTLALAAGMASASPKAPKASDDFSNDPRAIMISDIERLLSKQGAHFNKEFTASDGTIRWVFFYPDYHGIPAVLEVRAFPTMNQLIAANDAAIWEVVWVYYWLQNTGAAK